MNELQIKAALAGIFFGAWPLIMNRSKLPGNVSSLAFTAFAMLTVLPFAVRGFGQIPNDVIWRMAVFAGITAGIGLIFFNGMLAKATPENVGPLFVVMIVAQITIPVIYKITETRSMSPAHGIGFAAAAVSAYCLTR